MIAKLIAWGRDRDEALARLRRALGETMVVVEGGTTNQGFLLALLDRPEVQEGTVDTGWLDRLQLRGEIVPVRHADVALLQAAIELSDAETAADRARFYAYARRGRPQTGAASRRVVHLRYRGQSYRLAVSQIAPDRYRILVDGVAVEVETQQVGRHERRLVLAGAHHRTITSVQGPELLVEVDGVPHRVARDDGGMVRSLSPAVVVSIPVAEGDEVQAGDVVAVLESMKMETSLIAPFRGRVRRVLSGPNVQVAAQAPLLQLEELDGDGGRPTVAAGERIAFAALAGGPELDSVRRLEWLMLGFDGDAPGPEAIGDDAAEHERLLSVFADLCALARPSHDDEGDPTVRSALEHLHAYLGSLDAEAEGLPRAFVERLEAVLARYGVATLDRTPALEAACYRIFLATQRTGAVRPSVLALLDRLLERPPAGRRRPARGARPDRRRHHRLRPDRLRPRAPGPLPLLRRARHRRGARPRLRRDGGARPALAAEPEGPDRDERVRALVACTRPLAPMLLRRMAAAEPALRRVLLEVVARRFYRVRTLEGFAELETAAGPLLCARYRHDGTRRRLATAFVDLAGLAAAANSFAAWAAAVPAGDLAVADFYVHDAEDVTAERLHAILSTVALPASVHRIVVGVAPAEGGLGMSAIGAFTFRPGPDGLVEDEVLRGLHPMMAHRLRLWRLREFAIERLPSAEDVYLFHGSGRSNPKDERLFALAEVRDLTPVRDEKGRITALPEFELMLVEALEGIRRFQARRKPSRRLVWNRILLHVWPVIDLRPADIRALVERLAPQTAGLGIEMLVVHGNLRTRLHGARPRAAPLRAGGARRRRRDRRSAHAAAATARRGRPARHRRAPARDAAPGRDRQAARAAHGETAARGQPSASSPSSTSTPMVASRRSIARPRATPAASSWGSIRNRTERYPEGMLRVALLGDPTRALGSLAEPECLRIVAALDLAEELGVPCEWFALSAGAKIAMDSGTENMDWIAAVLRRIIEFTQAGGEINIVVTGINVGAQPYWNAEATMLMHTRGILVMTPGERDGADRQAGARLLRRRLGRGQLRDRRLRADHGPERPGAVLGARPRRRLPPAARLLRAHLRRARRAVPAPRRDRPTRSTATCAMRRTRRPARTSRASATSSRTRPTRGARSRSTSAPSCAPWPTATVAPLERWSAMRQAETAVVWDAHLGGWPVTLLGIESRPLARHGLMPADGPEQWTSGTLFPRSSKKIARAINAASGRRPVVVLANLAGFDGSPESMREWQLEYGAEIGRAVVNFDGPIVFCVVSRYHGGAFVVFSQRLNENLETVAVRGSHASVIGGAPAAAVVFARDVEQAAGRDPRIVALDERIAAADAAERVRLRSRAGRAVGRRAVREARRARGRVRRDAQRRASGPGGLGARAHRAGNAASLPHRRGRARHRARARRRHPQRP